MMRIYRVGIGKMHMRIMIIKTKMNYCDSHEYNYNQKSSNSLISFSNDNLFYSGKG